jgi:hypothetical protein
MFENNFFDYGGIDYPSVELPKPIIEEIDGILVVRDDLLDGGTKRRGFNFYIESFPQIEEWVYASPRQGYAQLALAYSCRDYGKRATVTIPKGERYWLTDAAEELGANIIEVPMGFLTNIQAKAKQYALQTPNCGIIPFGGDHPIIIEGIRKTALSLGINPPKEVWTVMSSGVLSRGLQRAWPDARIYGVQIGHGTTKEEMGRAITIPKRIPFHKDCPIEERPPFPSSTTYDSKAWKHIKEMAIEGALFWNVGR